MPTPMARTGGSLERARRLGGANALREELGRAAGKDRKAAVRLLETPSLRFPTLYLLAPVIGGLRLYPELNTRSQAVLRLCARQSADAQPVSTAGPPAGSIAGSPEQTRAALRWMLDTGLSDDGLDDGYDQLLDTAAALLVITWHDTSVLPQLIPVIFRRHRRERYIHDLVWVVFRSRDPRILEWIARYLRSPRQQDVDLADKLLRGTLEAGDIPAGRPLRFGAYRSWLAENQAYLRFTGEEFQQSSEPKFCRVDWNAKYLGRPATPVGGKEPAPPTPEEEARRRDFEALAPEDRRRLADVSCRLRRADRRRWRRWMTAPAARQLEKVRGGKERGHD